MGVLEDRVKVGPFIFLVDFVILDLEEDRHLLLTLGRPFLTIGRALIDVEPEELIIQFEN